MTYTTNQRKIRKIGFFKRRYADVRWGYAQIGFFIGLGNFLILFYNFTPAKDLVPFEYFAPIMIGVFLVMFALIGKSFRRRQMAIEHDLGFERAPKSAKLFRMILEQLEPTDEVIEQIQYLRNIESQRL